MFSQVLLLVLTTVALIVAMAFSVKVLLDTNEKIYKHFAYSPFAMGALIFGIGLSLPGTIFAQIAVRQGEFGTVLGMVVGVLASNLFLIYGMSGVFGRLLILRREILIQFYFQLGAILLLGPILVFGYYQGICGFILIAFFIFYLWMILGMIPGKISRRIPISEKDIVVGHPWIWLKAFVALGVLIAAEVFLVGKSQEIGKGPEVSSFVMSAIIMGLAATFPQLLVALIAMITKKNTDIITGSVIGSNIFYGCFVFGTTCFYNFDFKRNFLTEW
ncbi:MAG: hypothetical protein AABY86_06820, partial [Bdellovibrionota bacterium]